MPDLVMIHTVEMQGRSREMSAARTLRRRLAPAAVVLPAEVGAGQRLVGFPEPLELCVGVGVVPGQTQLA